jgi:hypothetical protein
MQPVMQESVVEEAHHESHDQDGGLLVPEQGLEQTPHDEDPAGRHEEGDRDQGFRIIVMEPMTRGRWRPIVMVAPPMDSVLQEPIQPQAGEQAHPSGDPAPVHRPHGMDEEAAGQHRVDLIANRPESRPA